MPKEYIARDAAIIGLAASSLLPHQIDDAAEALQLVPAADVVEVVRCRECIYYEYDAEIDAYVCTGVMAYSTTSDDWYCASGIYKDGGQDE